MTQLEILELAREGIMHRMGAAIQAEARAVVNIIPGTSTGEAIVSYWRDYYAALNREMQKLEKLIDAEKAKAEG